jgi:hypothetical protein
MSDTSLGEGWWLASDGRWYPPETVVGDRPPPPLAIPPMPSAGRYCTTCGNGLVATAAICPRCGTPVAGSSFAHSAQGGKSRSTAVILAVFFSFWSFLYTYSVSARKFWVGFGISFLAVVFVIIARDVLSNNTTSYTGEPLVVVLGVGVWIWSIIDRATTPL